MRTNFFFCWALFFSLASPIHAQSNQDETAIIALIQAETDAFAHESLYDVTKRYWILDSHSVRCVSFMDGNNYQHRYLDLIDSKIDPPTNNVTFTQKDFKVQINGNFATVTFIQDATMTEEGMEERVCTRETVVVEKVKSEWRIHMKSVHHFKPTN
jgi:ketosteroid isomerase-like protein